jgi:hypothetical protein
MAVGPQAVQHFDWSTLGGWVAAIGMAFTWASRALSVVRRLDRLETTMRGETAQLRDGQKRQEQDLRDLRGLVERHLQSSSERGATP